MCRKGFIDSRLREMKHNLRYDRMNRVATDGLIARETASSMRSADSCYLKRNNCSTAEESELLMV